MNIKKLFTVGGSISIQEPRIICKPEQIVKGDSTYITHAQVKLKKHSLHITSESISLAKIARKRKIPEVKNTALKFIMAHLTNLAAGFSQVGTTQATCAVIPVDVLRHILDAVEGDTVCVSIACVESKGDSQQSIVSLFDSVDRKTIAHIVVERVRAIGGMPLWWHNASIAGKKFWSDVSGVYMKRDLAEDHIKHENITAKKFPKIAKAFGIKHMPLPDDNDEEELPRIEQPQKSVAIKKVAAKKSQASQKQLKEDVAAAVKSAGITVKKNVVKRNPIGIRKPVKKKSVR